ncbi:hypothetical protein Sango_1583200 [Sesamum angolense]|uniref:Reverse transcriptase domain-containing protein n=1 Tax=Sesamum angolense TaxID=2727404 RepID=A0AAE1WQ05_9LAMI|nr:hypothetical protein Sango_1583200 [Sesamum angolense]
MNKEKMPYERGHSYDSKRTCSRRLWKSKEKDIEGKNNLQKQAITGQLNLELNKRMRMERIEPTEEYKKVKLVIGELSKTTRIGSRLISQMETLIIEFPRKNTDMFAWSPSDFKGIDPEVIVHRSNVDPKAKLVKQKKRSFRMECNRIIEEEVNKLLKAGYVAEVQYTEWLSNMVVNACATYQKLVNRMFKDLIRKTMEVYVDYMLIKNKEEKEHLTHLQAAFEVMRRYGMKLNSAKCTFGVRGGKFLGYMVSEKVIQVNPEKVETIMRMGSPKTIKNVQKLIGKVTSLARSISRSVDRNLSFFKTLRKVKGFQ